MNVFRLFMKVLVWSVVIILCMSRCWNVFVECGVMGLV